MDYQHCFDKIDRSFLWQKHISMGVSSKFVRAVKSMYASVKSCVRFNNEYSEYFD